jgi:hypothetical protein
MRRFGYSPFFLLRGEGHLPKSIGFCRLLKRSEISLNLKKHRKLIQMFLRQVNGLTQFLARVVHFTCCSQGLMATRSCPRPSMPKPLCCNILLPLILLCFSIFLLVIFVYLVVLQHSPFRHLRPFCLATSSFRHPSLSTRSIRSKFPTRKLEGLVVAELQRAKQELQHNTVSYKRTGELD